LKRALSSALFAGALAVGSIALAGAQPASATTGWLLQNVATGKCMQATTTSTAVYEVKMATCSKSNPYQKWAYQSGHVVAIVGGTRQVCMGIQKSPSGDFAREVVTTACTSSSTWGINFSTGITSNYPVASVAPSCYVGHYSSGDSWPSCYVNQGSSTRWNWVAAP